MLMYLFIVHSLIAVGYGVAMYYEMGTPKRFTKWYQRGAALAYCIAIGFGWPAFYGAKLCKDGQG